MKNIILTALLLIQVILLASRGGHDTPTSAARTWGVALTPSVALAPLTPSSELSAWLEEHEVNPDKAASTLSLNSEDLKAALKGAPLSAELAGELSAAVASRKVTALTISEGPQEEGEEGPAPSSISLTLEGSSEGEQWRVKSAKGYPAGAAKVRSALTKLLGAELGSVMATRAAHHTKLRVSELTHDRKLTFTVGGEERVWFVGNAKGNAVHVREASSERVYRVRGLSVWGDMNTELNRFVEGPYFSFKDASELKVSGPDERALSLKMVGERWQVEGVKAEELDESKAKIFARSASELRLTEVTHKLTGEHQSLKGVEEAKAFGFDKPATITLKGAEGEASFELALKGEDAYVYAPKSPFIVKVDAYKVRPLYKQTLDDFLNEATQQARAQAAEQPPEVSPAPAPAPEVSPEPAPAPEVSPAPAPAPEVSPTPAPAPEVSPAPAPAPEVSPAPAPAPEVSPAPASAPQGE